MARGGIIFVSKTACVVLVLLCFVLLPSVSRAQLIPHGNVYVGATYSSSVDVTARYPFRGWEASGEVIPFSRYSFAGFVVDGTGLYNRSHGVTQYNILAGPRIAVQRGKWRPFVHALGGIELTTINDVRYRPVAYDFGGGVDYKLFFKNFSWRFQADYLHTHMLSAVQNDYRGSTGIVWRF